jgi:hypothetical protein
VGSQQGREAEAMQVWERERSDHALRRRSGR